MGIRIEIIHGALVQITQGKTAADGMNIQGIRPERALRQQVPRRTEDRAVNQHHAQKNPEIPLPVFLFFQNPLPRKPQHQQRQQHKQNDQRHRIYSLGRHLQIIALINGRKNQTVQE